jgi:hypothetical protein
MQASSGKFIRSFLIESTKIDFGETAVFILDDNNIIPACFRKRIIYQAKNTESRERAFIVVYRRLDLWTF